MEPCEWHHSSKHFNQVDYYDGELLLRLAAIDNGDNSPAELDDEEDEDIVEAGKILARLRGWRKPKSTAKRWTGCTVSWLEWGGTRSRPKATEHTATDCAVEWKGGKFCTVTFPTGNSMRKGLDTKGFCVHDTAGKRVYF